MTQEEKAKAYDEALKKIKVLQEDWKSTHNRAWKEIEEVFPQLAESEDEKIRKWLYDYIERVGRTWGKQPFHYEQILAWLEKQKEQKPVEIEVYEVGKGTTIYGQDYKCKKDYKEGNCWFIKDAIYHCSMDGYLTDQNGISWCCTPKWFKEYIQSNTEWAEEEKTRFVSGQFLQCKLSFDEFKEGEHYWLEYVGDDTYVGRSDNILNLKFHITPRQLFTLFSQELEEVQGPPQEEKQVSLNYEQPFNENPSDKEIIEALIRHLKEQDGFLTAIDCVSTKAILTWLEKQKEQKPEERFEEAREKYQAEWSEEDEDKIKDIIDYLECWNDFDHGSESFEEYRKRMEGNIRFMKSLRPQPKQERSEEKCPHYSEGYGCEISPMKKCESCEKRPRWKPSEEQKEALEYAIHDYRRDSCNATANHLQEILDHLKNM